MIVLSYIKRHLPIIVFGMITIWAYRCFDYKAFENNQIVKLSNMLLVLCLFVFVYPVLVKNKSNKFSKIVRAIILSLILSMFSAWLFWGQSILLTYRVGYGSFLYITFFYLVKYKISHEDIESYIIFFGVLFSVLWLYAFSQYPATVFKADGEDVFLNEDTSRGMLRINFVGHLHLVLAYFLCLTKYNIGRRKIYLFGTLFFFLFIIFQVTRQFILFSFVIGVIYYFYHNRRFLVIVGLFSLLLLGGGISLLPKDNVFSTMIELTKEQSEDSKSGNTDIRILEYELFFTDFSKNIITDIIGNGEPHSDGPYGKYVNELTKRGYWLTDVGYAYIYVVMGIVGLFIFIKMIIVSAKTKVPPEQQYAKLFIICMAFCNIASGVMLERNGVICICVCLYVLGLSRNRNYLFLK